MYKMYGTKKINNFQTIIWSIVIGVIITCVFSAYADKTEESIADGLIRLHVIANSNSEDDQHLKIAVRDAIIEKSQHIFADNTNKTEAEAEITAQIEDIKKIADEVVLQWGYDYPVRVELGKSDFPTKVYGNITLPAGTYDALKVIIGNGSGENWWCVIFPPLCFVDSATANMPKESSEILKSSLSDEEYAMVTGDDNLPVKVKFKAYEMWQSSKIKLKNMVATKKGEN